jgi:hypothetical protein
MVKKSIKILVGYHKPAHVFQNEILTPIQLGRKNAAEIIPGMLGDDSGDNISELNPMFCETTALYWAWRNYAELGDPDYFGLLHYRRLLDFSPPEMYAVEHVDSVEDVRAESIDPENIRRLVERYDLCVKAPLSIAYFAENNEEKIFTVLGQYLAAHRDRYIINAYELVSGRYPEYAGDIKLYSTGTGHYLCNIAVMRKEIFFDYAAWLFSILLPLHKMIDYKRHGQDIRAISYLSERLTGLYMFRQARLGKWKMCILPSINIGCW